MVFTDLVFVPDDCCGSRLFAVAGTDSRRIIVTDSGDGTYTVAVTHNGVLAKAVHRQQTKEQVNQFLIGI